MTARAWWQDGLLLLGGALLCLALGWFVGGAAAERSAARRTEAALARIDSAEVAHAGEVARLRAALISRDTMIAAAARKTARAEAGIAEARQQTDRTRAALARAMVAADSLAAYPPLVASLEQQLAATDSAGVGYREERDEERRRSGELLARIAQDSVLIARYRDERRQIVVAPPTTGSGWGCVAGVTVATGIRSGAGLGIACGRRLR